MQRTWTLILWKAALYKCVFIIIIMMVKRYFKSKNKVKDTVTNMWTYELWWTGILKMYYSTWELKPSVVIIKKKRVAHSGATGIVASPSGYTTNTSPGPIKYEAMHLFNINWIYIKVYKIYKTLITKTLITLKKLNFHVEVTND